MAWLVRLNVPTRPEFCNKQTAYHHQLQRYQQPGRAARRQSKAGRATWTGCPRFAGAPTARKIGKPWPSTVTYPNGEAVTLTFDREGENNLEAGNNLLVTDTFGLWYTLCMDASEARAYIQRWEAVSELEKQERKSHSVADNWRQLNAIRQRAARLGICRQNDDGEMALILLWARLKAQYGHK